MSTRESTLDSFFDQYGQVYNAGIRDALSDADLERAAALYADCFLAANPKGVACSANDAAFRQAMRKGYAYYREIGITQMDIVSKEISLLDDFHAMVKVRFKASFRNQAGQPGQVEFENIYFTQQLGDQPKVFAYISADEEKVLQDCGLL